MEEDSPTSRREKRALLMAFLESDAFGPASPVIESPPVGPQDFARLVSTQALDDVPSSQAPSRRASASDSSSSSSSGSGLSTNISLKEGKRLFESRVQNVSRRLEKTQQEVPASLNPVASAQPEREEESLYMEEKTSFLDDDGPETSPVENGDASSANESAHGPPAIPRLNLQKAQKSSPSHKASGVEETPQKIGTQAQLIRRVNPGSENRSKKVPPASTTDSDCMSSASTTIVPARSHDDSSSSSEGLSDFSVPRVAAAALNRSNPVPRHTNTGDAGDKHTSPSARGNTAAARQSRANEKLEQVIAEATKDLTFSPHISDLPPMYHEHHMRRQSQSPHGHKYHPAVEEASKELTFSPRIHLLPDMYREHHEQRLRHRQRAVSQPILSPKGRAGGSVSAPTKGGGGSPAAHSFSFPARANCHATGNSRKFGVSRGRGGNAPFHARAMAWQNRLDMRIRDMADAEQRQRDTECSFRPRILNRSRNVVSTSLASGVMKRNYRNGVVERYVEERDRKLEESCTFAPKINHKSRQLAEKWRRISYQCHHAHAHFANQCPQVVAAACCDDPSCASDEGKFSECASVCSCSCSEVSSVAGASVGGGVGVGVAPLPVEFLNREERELEQATFVPATNKVPGKMKKVSKYLEADVASRLYEKSPFLPKKKTAKKPKAAPGGQIGEKKCAGSNKEGKWKSFITRYEEDHHRREVNRKLLSQREANSSRPIVNAKSEAMAARRGKSFAERLDVHNEARAKLNEKIAAIAAKETPFQPQLCPKTATILERAVHDEDGNMLIRRRVSSFDEDLTFAPKVNVRKSRKISRELNSYLDKSPHERLATGARPFSPSRRASKVKALMRAVGKKSSDSQGAFMKVVNKKTAISKAVVKSSDSNDREKETKSPHVKPDDASTATPYVRKAESEKAAAFPVREPPMKTNSVDIDAVSEPAQRHQQRGGADDQADIDAIQRRSICTLAPRMRVPTCSDIV